MAIRLKSREELEKMRIAGRVVHQVLEHCREICKPGVTTQRLDDEAYRVFTELGAEGLFKNYPSYKQGEGFPANTCISVNEVVVHGIADDYEIQDGDIVGIDCGVRVNGWCGDAATTLLVGDVAEDVRKLCETTQHVLNLAIENIKPGRRWSQIARLMQTYAESHNYSVVRELVGHGVGSTMHEDPKVPNYVNRDLIKNDILLRPGMVLAVEPMLNLGAKDIQTLEDGWTIVTADRQPAAHYEHTVAVTHEGTDVLTSGQ